MRLSQWHDAQIVARVASPGGEEAQYEQEAALDQIGHVRGPESDQRYSLDFLMGTFSSPAEWAMESSLQALRQIASHGRWNRRVVNCRLGADVDELSVTVAAALDHIAEYGPESFGLPRLMNSEVQPEHLAAVLRATSTWRDEIPGWHAALERAAHALAKEGIDPQDALFGMI